jgi:FKBP-type peptidyl-prolyl cis-trans isomerase
VTESSPFSFPLGQGTVIQGWEEAFSLLKVGTVARLLIPSTLGYGAYGVGRVPANAVLVSDITFVSAT